MVEKKMELYEKCISLATGPKISDESESKTEYLVLNDESDDYHITFPSFIGPSPSDWLQRTVYYISDLHLVHHVIHEFPNGASDNQIQEYIHSVVLRLFSGAFGDEVRSWNCPIVLFGGDVASSFSVAEMFYRDFIATWENEVNKRHNDYCAVLEPLNDKIIQITDQLRTWKEKHPWIKHAQKPWTEYSNKKVPIEIKELYSQVQKLKDQYHQQRSALNIPMTWKTQHEIALKHPYIYTILGNHELWDFDSCKSCELAFRRLFEELGINFLCDQMSWLGKYEAPKIFRPEQSRYLLLRKEDNAKEYEEKMFYMQNIIIVGGIGFAGMNTEFNANQGIYGNALNRDEEVERSAKWRRLLQKAIDIANEHHCSVVVLTHTPITDWTSHPGNYSNCFFFTGHTHRNLTFQGENNSFIFADNQVGYRNERFCFKKAVLHVARNPFAADADGYREITCNEFKEYYRYIGDFVPGTGTFEAQMEKYDAKLYVMKKENYIGFFLTSPKGVYICNGGLLRKVGHFEPLDRYFSNFKIVIHKYINALTPLRRAQERISQYIKSFGGNGKIHGTIVDIDFENHIMVNISDGTIVPYNSPMFGILKTYPDIGTLIHEQCPLLEDKYNAIGRERLIPVSTDFHSAEGNYVSIDIKNSPYAISRRVNALQRLFDKRILRDWNPELEEI